MAEKEQRSKDPKTGKLRTEEQEVQIWFDRIARGKKLRDKRLKEVKIYVDFYKSNQWGHIAWNPSDKPVVNLFFAHIKTQLPFLYFQNPKWIVTPTGRNRKDYVENGKIATEYLNYYTQENIGKSLKYQVRYAIMDAFFLFGAVKTGCVKEMEMNVNYKKPLKNEIGKILVGDNGEPILDQNEDVLVNEKFVSRRVSPAALIFDIEAQSCFEDGRYIIEQIHKPLLEIKADKKYTNTKDLAASYTVKPGINVSPSDAKTKPEYEGIEDDLSRLTMYEIYDVENDRLKVVAEGGTKYLRNVPMPDGIDRHPYSFLLFNEVPDEIYGVSDLRSLKSPQEEINKGRAMLMIHAKRFGRKYAYISAGFKEDEDIEKIKSGEDGVMFEVTELPLNKIIEPLVDAPLDPAVLQNFNQSFVDFREVGGASEMDRQVVERRKTAYEASKISESGQVRKQDRKSLVEDFASDIGSKMLQSMQANMTMSDVVKIGKNNNDEDWKTVDRETIKMQANVKVELGSMVPKLPEFERQDFMMVMQMLAQFPPELIKVWVNMEGLLRSIPQMFPSLENFSIINEEDVVKQMQQDQQLEILRQTLLARGGKGGGAAGGTGGAGGGGGGAAPPQIQQLLKMMGGGGQ